MSSMMLLKMEEDTEKEKLLQEEEAEVELRTEVCNATRFTIITLAGVVVILLTAVYCLMRWPGQGPACFNTAKSGSVVFETRSGGTLIGLIADIHLNLKPEACVGKSGSKYGQFGCDSTHDLLNITLSDMSTNLQESEHKILMLMGDAGPHQREDIYDYKVTVASMKVVFKQLEQYFPDCSVFPTMGNNDLPSHNTLPNISWYSSLLNMYEPAIKRDSLVKLPQDFREMFMYGGFYSAQYGDKFTVISLNTNLFSAKVADKNAQRDFATAHLEWLNSTLEATEGQVVIIGHHPPTLLLYYLYHNKAAKASWRSDYFVKFRDIHQAHSQKVFAMFFGHEHQDTYSVARHSGVDMALFTIPAVSPIYSGQPSYCVAVVNSQADEGQILKDIHTFHTWLDYYNRLKTAPKFFTYQSFGTILGLKELRSRELFDKTINIIDESDGMNSFLALKNKIYQERVIPPITAHLYYCYTTNLDVASFIQCIEQFGYDGKTYVINY